MLLLKLHSRSNNSLSLHYVLFVVRANIFIDQFVFYWLHFLPFNRCRTREDTSSDESSQEQIQMDTIVSGKDIVVGYCRPGVHAEYGTATVSGDTGQTPSFQPGKFADVSKSSALSGD